MIFNDRPSLNVFTTIDSMYLRNIGCIATMAIIIEVCTAVRLLRLIATVQRNLYVLMYNSNILPCARREGQKKVR